MDKEDILKKIVSLEFGRFLKYYADAPEILKPTNERGARGSRGTEPRTRGGKGADRARGPRKAEAGYKRLFINLGKDDGFYPGEVMQFVNRHVNGRQDIGHIDLLGKFSYIEVPEQDAAKVTAALDGATYKGRSVRCNDADSRSGASARGASKGGRRGEGNGRKGKAYRDDGADGGFARYEKKSKRKNGRHDDGSDDTFRESGKKDDWKQFFRHDDVQLKGSEPDFSEEGWARRKPRKK